jgi:hypothetical protein
MSSSFVLTEFWKRFKCHGHKEQLEPLDVKQVEVTSGQTGNRTTV